MPSSAAGRREARKAERARAGEGRESRASRQGSTWVGRGVGYRGREGREKGGGKGETYHDSPQVIPGSVRVVPRQPRKEEGEAAR